MRFFKQRYLHDPDNGEIGDCYRTCIAMLTGHERDEVPHFVGDAWAAAGRDDPQGAMDRLAQWLMDHRIHRIQYCWLAKEGDKLEDALAMASNFCGNMVYMLSGMSRSGCPHVVLCYNHQMIFDPSKVDSGIIGPILNDEGQWIFSVEFYVIAAYDTVGDVPILKTKMPGSRRGFVFNDVYHWETAGDDRTRGQKIEEVQKLAERDKLAREEGSQVERERAASKLVGKGDAEYWRERHRQFLGGEGDEVWD